MEGIFVMECIRRTKYWPRMTDFPSQIGRHGSEVTTYQSPLRLFTLRNSDIDMKILVSFSGGKKTYRVLIIAYILLNVIN